MPPPSGPPLSRSSTPAREGSPASNADGDAPPLKPQGVAALNGPPSAPPSRPGTSMSNASSIEDLLGAAAPRKGGTVKGKKRGGRYIDVMGQK